MMAIKSGRSMFKKNNNLALERIYMYIEHQKHFHSGFRKTAEVLIQNGADVNLVGHDGKTALMHATEKVLDKIVQMLIDAGAKVNDKDNNNDTALILASKRGIEA